MLRPSVPLEFEAARTALGGNRNSDQVSCLVPNVQLKNMWLLDDTIIET
jgi:hypothetical protein